MLTVMVLKPFNCLKLLDVRAASLFTLQCLTFWQKVLMSDFYHMQSSMKTLQTPQALNNETGMLFTCRYTQMAEMCFYIFWNVDICFVPRVGLTLYESPSGSLPYNHVVHSVPGTQHMIDVCFKIRYLSL